MPKKSLVSTGKVLIAIQNNDYQTFKEHVANSFLNGPIRGYYALHQAIGLGRSQMVVDIADALTQEKSNYSLESKFQFNKETFQCNILQTAAMYCSVEAVQALVKYHNICATKDSKDISSLLKDEGIKEELGTALLTTLINTMSSTNLEACIGADPSKYKSASDIGKAKSKILNLHNRLPVDEANAEKISTHSSDGSTDVSDPSTDAVTKKDIIELLWVGPVQMIEYLLTIPGFDVSDANDLDMAIFARVVNEYANGTDNLSYWEFRAKDEFILRGTTIESIDIDHVSHKPVMNVTMKDLGGTNSVHLSLTFDLSAMRDMVKAKLEFGRKDLVRKSSLKRVEDSVSELKSKWEQTPEGMNAAILQALVGTPALCGFYSELHSCLSRELKKINVHDKNYFINKNFKYKLAVAAISVIGESQGVIGNIAAGAVKQGAHMLVSYQGDRQAAAVFELSPASVHPEELIAVSVSYALTKKLSDKIEAGTLDVLEVKKAFVEIMKGLYLHKDSIAQGNDAFENLAEQIVAKLNQRPGACCTIS